ncbi:MAG: glycosyltransferase family 2 protein [Candidatus Omnitrophota bacterium]
MNVYVRDKMDDRPMVSVITPVYNGELYLAKCIESILAQTLPDFEYIIIDDGSSDGTWAVMEQYAGKDPRIVLIKNERNMGQASSMNIGIKNAKTGYIAVMDSDDMSKPDRLKKQIDFLNSNKDYGGCGALQSYIDKKDDSLPIKEPPKEKGDVTDLMRDSCQLSHSTCMFRCDVLDEVGGYREAFERAQDYDLFLRISEKYRLYNIPEVLLDQRFTLERATMSDRKRQMAYSELALKLADQRRQQGQDILQEGDRDSFQKLKREIFGPQLSPRWMELSSNYLYWSHRMYHRGPISYARGLIWKAIRYNPLNIVAWSYMLYLYSGKGFREGLAKLKRMILH